MPDPLLSRGIAQVPLLKMFASPITLRGASKPAQPTDPPGIPLSVPTLLPIAGDVLGALHLVYEVLCVCCVCVCVCVWGGGGGVI